MATVDVFVLDSNDQKPFMYDVTNLTISSDLELGTIIKCFTPSDTDALTYFEFTLSAGNAWFAVDRFNGCLFLIDNIADDKQVELNVSDGKNKASKLFTVKVRAWPIIA